MAIASALFIVCFCYFNSENRDTVSGQGWDTLRSAKAFRSGTIIYGSQPVDFQISLIEPKLLPQETVKPSETRQFLVSIQLSSGKAPPTFVTVRWTQGNKLFSTAFHDSLGGGKGTFYFSVPFSSCRIPSVESPALHRSFRAGLRRLVPLTSRDRLLRGD